MDAAAAHRAEAQELMLQVLVSPSAALLQGSAQDPTAFQQMAALQLMGANPPMPMLFGAPMLPTGFQALSGMALQPPLGGLVANPNGVSGAFVVRTLSHSCNDWCYLFTVLVSLVMKRFCR